MPIRELVKSIGLRTYVAVGKKAVAFALKLLYDGRTVIH